MVYNGDIKYKGTSSKAYPLTITEPPQVTHSDIISEEYSVPGRNGTLYSKNPYRGNATITVKFALVADDGVEDGVSKYRTAWRQVNTWLQGIGDLVIEDGEDAHYEVLRVIIASDTRAILRYGTLEVNFIVYPFEFLDEGDVGIEGGTIDNDGDQTEPLYKIVGTGTGTLTVNGNTMTYEVEDELYIDVRRSIAYDQDGENMNNKLAGDYEELRLIPGENTVSATTGTLTIYPKWGFNI